MSQISNIMLPFMLLVLGTTTLGTAALKFAREISYSFSDNPLKNMLDTSLYTIFGFSLFALFAYSVLSLFLSISRYYKNFFTDEGYLTFTLPVKSHTLIFSKLWSTILWLFISVVVVIACVFIYITFGGAPLGKLFNLAFYEELGELIRVVLKTFFTELTVSSAFFVIEGIVLVFVEVLYAILSLFLAITLGSIIAKKHKILASIGMYYLINMVTSTATTVLMTGFLLGPIGVNYDFSTSSLTSYIHILLISTALIYAVIMVIEFLLINNFIKKKLNLQ